MRSPLIIVIEPESYYSDDRFANHWNGNNATTRTEPTDHRLRQQRPLVPLCLHLVADTGTAPAQLVLYFDCFHAVLSLLNYFLN